MTDPDMLKALYDALVSDDNPHSLSARVAKLVLSNAELTERVAKLEGKIAVAGTIIMAAFSIWGVMHRGGL
jgi:hypothetical protein